MGKVSYNYTDSSEDTASSVDYSKKKKRSSILKPSANNVKKKSKHSKSDLDYSGLRSVSNHRVRYRLPGILKNSNVEKERESSEEDEEVDYSKYLNRDRCLVGRVPFAPGKPGRGGGLAILVKKNVSGTKIDKFLFGSDLADGLKAAKAISKQKSAVVPATYPIREIVEEVIAAGSRTEPSLSENMQPLQSTSSTKSKRKNKLNRKKSY